jgi:hypothetical protein
MIDGMEICYVLIVGRLVSYIQMVGFGANRREVLHFPVRDTVCQSMARTE